ncbi:hypothetical protein IC620_14800 [Hazenella sp. IB182357]|uniref:Uncharacterized protein n=1 Tax=Polycladospora coralii TaxID=2771432 RepID=A0A926NHF3_9BACL|nr:hypothetical protein [Polycladospora coralii]MBD1373614.1 hypothetical protein [Polycladospora coralii]MBS7529657.1 hypothetical protein [Polycladospora coralii]
MKFTIKGWLYDHVTLYWENGQLTSDRADILQVVFRRIDEIEASEAFLLCPKTHLFFTSNYLDEGYSAYLVLKHILEFVSEEPNPEELLYELSLPNGQHHK